MKKKYLPAFFLVLGWVGMVFYPACNNAETTQNTTNQGTTQPISTPDSTLALYYQAISEYNLGRAKSLLYDPYTDYHLPRPLVINTYRITNRKTLAAHEAAAIEFIPPLQAGDVELAVNEVRNGQAQDYRYWFRQKDSLWLLYGWMVKYNPEEIEDDP